MLTAGALGAAARFSSLIELGELVEILGRGHEEKFL
jgi:hypothetical protein